MNFADAIALTLMLLVGGYIFAVGILPQLFHWIAGWMGLSHSHPDSPSHPTLS
jgi:hypothetical protein